MQFYLAWVLMVWPIFGAPIWGLGVPIASAVLMPAGLVRV